MLKIDSQFLEEVGAGRLEGEQRDNYQAKLQEELEIRVGEKMSEGMTEEQIAEFDGIMNGDRGVMIRALAKLGDYQSDEIYQKLLKKYGVEQGTMDILSEFLSIKWVKENRPDYAEITKTVFEQLKNEVKAKNSVA